MSERHIRPGVRRLLRFVLNRNADERDIDEEIRFHLEQRERQLIARGFDASSALQCIDHVHRDTCIRCRQHARKRARHDRRPNRGARSQRLPVT